MSDLPNLDLDDDLDLILKLASDDELKSLIVTHQEVESFKQSLGPQTKDEFAAWIKSEIGHDLGRTAVCPGHSSQLDVFWEIYSFQVKNILVIFNRGGGKTSGLAWIDYCSAKHYPGFSSFTIGPGMDQGKRKYEHIIPFVTESGVFGGKPLTSNGIARTTMQETNWANGSKVEISLGGGVENANGPRTVRLHRDETELMQYATYQQAANIPAGKWSRDGRWMPSQTVDTSTMKFAGGLIDRQLKQYLKEVEAGDRPSLEVRICCIFEMAAENPACRSVPAAQREARLAELGLDTNKICDCHTYKKDVWEAEGDAEPEVRTLEGVCRGRFFQSRGYKDFGDIQHLFSTNDRATWNAEQECSEPSGEGVFLKGYSQVRHGIKNYTPRPEWGTIYQGVDWGGTDEHAIAWYQLIEVDDAYADYWVSGERRQLERGDLVIFDEIFVANIGDMELADLVIARELKYVQQYPGWKVHERYPDSADRNARLNWRDRKGLNTTSRIRKDFMTGLKLVRTRVGSKNFAIAIDKCKKMDESIRGWRQENGREVHDENSHMMAQFRYVEQNFAIIFNKQERAKRGNSASAVVEGDLNERAEERSAEIERSISVFRVNAEGDRVADDDPDVLDYGDVAVEASPRLGSAFSMGTSDYRTLR